MAEGEMVCRGLTAEEIEAQYMLRKVRPDYETALLPGWQERSAAFRAEAAGAEIDLPYGPGSRDRFDLFPADKGQGPFLVYVHGGYWQRGDKSVYSLVARPFVEAGITVALINYDLCPETVISAQIGQVRRAVACLWREAGKRGFARDRFCVMGHSAGGHLAAETMATDWTALDPELPSDMLAAGVPLSGVYDFAPLLYCSENEGLRLDEDEARRVSTLLKTMPTDAPQLVAWGERETPDWQCQSRQYVERFASDTRRIDTLVVPDADHFDVVDVLSDPASELVARSQALIWG